MDAPRAAFEEVDVDVTEVVLAELAGQTLEADQRSPTLQTLRTVARVLRVKVGRLVEP